MRLGDLDGGCGAEHLPDAASDDMEIVEVEAEEPEDEDDGFETDYASVAIACEDEELYKNMGEDEYDEYRWQCSGDAVGVERYVAKRLGYLRRF